MRFSVLLFSIAISMLLIAVAGELWSLYARVAEREALLHEHRRAACLAALAAETRADAWASALRRQEARELGASKAHLDGMEAGWFFRVGALRSPAHLPRACQ